jgi:hypothetical protein
MAGTANPASRPTMAMTKRGSTKVKDADCLRWEERAAENGKF